ncbi:MAG: universal stress protein [Anaerolineae bacterium]|nr:universal stress protein [Anaerolineae bacterium]
MLNEDFGEQLSPFTYILVPVDSSQTSINAGQLALRIAAMHNVPVTFMFIINPAVAEEIAAATAQTIDAVCQDLTAKAQRSLDYLLRMARTQGVQAEQVIQQGVPYREITDWARERGVDLIVIGKTGRSGSIRTVRSGDVFERVLEYAPCPVLVVRYSP